MRPMLMCASLALLVCVSLGNADLMEPRKFEAKEQILPMTARTYTGAFKGGEAAQALVSGKEGQSCLGLYVFDADGQCVALDDLTAPQTSEDLGVEWIPNTTGRYSVVVQNAGPEVNPYRLAIR